VFKYLGMKLINRNEVHNGRNIVSGKECCYFVKTVIILSTFQYSKDQGTQNNNFDIYCVWLSTLSLRKNVNYKYLRTYYSGPIFRPTKGDISWQFSVVHNKEIYLLLLG
jgi:hypothetical protein